MIAKDLCVVLGGKAAHLPLNGGRYDCGPAGRYAIRDDAVEEGDHLVGQPDCDLGGHGLKSTPVHPILGCTATPGV